MSEAQKLFDVILDFDTYKKLIRVIHVALLNTLKLLQENFCYYQSCEMMMKNTQSRRVDCVFKTIVTIASTFLDFILEIVSILLMETKIQQLERELVLPPPPHFFFNLRLCLGGN